MDGMMAGMGLWGLLVLLTVVALLVLAVLGSVWFSRQLQSRRTDSVADDGDAARNRLRERFAAGEIDEDEFERRLSALTHWR
jgi:Predicted membrane protein